MGCKVYLLIISQLLFLIVSGSRWSLDKESAEASHPIPYASLQDQQPAASGHHHGRVQIKVYRGPDHGHHHFAPHGYWIKQPADSDHHH